jgi:hypothetical protein
MNEYGTWTAQKWQGTAEALEVGAVKATSYTPNPTLIVLEAKFAAREV